MKGGFVSCINNNWKPENPGERYNELEADALNELGICRNNKGNDKYDMNNYNDWYIKSKPTNKKSLGEILDDLKKININKLNPKKTDKSDNNFYQAYKILQNVLRLREEKNAKFENKLGSNLTPKTKGHINYIKDLQMFIERIDLDSDYIEQRRKLMNINKTKKSTNITRNRTTSNSRSKRRNRSRSRSRSSSTKKNRAYR